MSRPPRRKSDIGMYHVILRGVNRKTIFVDDADCRFFMNALFRVKERSAFALFSYCLMKNHVHLLLQERDEPMELIFKRLCVSYAYYFNHKYEESGHLFQDRYRSEAVTDDAYFLTVLRYICQNPVKAGVCKTPFDYRWLGCSMIVDPDHRLDSLEGLTSMSARQLKRWVLKLSSEECMEDV